MFLLTFLVKQENGLIEFNLKIYVTAWLTKQLQYTWCLISQEVKVIRHQTMKFGKLIEDNM